MAFTWYGETYPLNAPMVAVCQDFPFQCASSGATGSLMPLYRVPTAQASLGPVASTERYPPWAVVHTLAIFHGVVVTVVAFAGASAPTTAAVIPAASAAPASSARRLPRFPIRFTCILCTP